MYASVRTVTGTGTRHVCTDREGLVEQRFPTRWGRSHWLRCHTHPSKAARNVLGSHQTAACSVLQTRRRSKEGKQRSGLRMHLVALTRIPTAPCARRGTWCVCGYPVPVLFLDGLPCSSSSATDVPRNNGRKPKCSLQISNFFPPRLEGAHHTVLTQKQLLCTHRAPCSWAPTICRALTHPLCAGL